MGLDSILRLLFAKGNMISNILILIYINDISTYIGSKEFFLPKLSHFIDNCQTIRIIHNTDNASS